MFNRKKVERLEKEVEQLKKILSSCYIRNKKGQFEKYRK
jgi:hypothetical protein